MAASSSAISRFSIAASSVASSKYPHPPHLSPPLLRPRLVPELVTAIKRSRAPRLYICNLMTQPGETDGLDVRGHIRAIEAQLASLGIDYEFGGYAELAGGARGSEGVVAAGRSAAADGNYIQPPSRLPRLSRLNSRERSLKVK